MTLPPTNLYLYLSLTSFQLAHSALQMGRQGAKGREDLRPAGQQGAQDRLDAGFHQVYAYILSARAITSATVQERYMSGDSIHACTTSFTSPSLRVRILLRSATIALDMSMASR
jgi:hypothetical protein